jgi:hypothetical protein
MAQELGDIGKGVKEQFLTTLLDVCKRRAGKGHRTGDIFLGATDLLSGVA